MRKNTKAVDEQVPTWASGSALAPSPSQHTGNISKTQRKPGAAYPKSTVSTSPQPRGNGLERKMDRRIKKGEPVARAGDGTTGLTTKCKHLWGWEVY